MKTEVSNLTNMRKIFHLEIKSNQITIKTKEMATLKGNYPTKTKTFDGKVYISNLKAMTKSDLEKIKKFMSGAKKVHYKILKWGNYYFLYCK